MARFFERNLPQTATVWTQNSVDSAGDITFDSASPRTINVRWEARTQMLFQQDGEQEVSVGMVVVAEDLAVGDYMFLGTSIASSPIDLEGAYQVKDFQKIPTRNGKNFFRRCRL